MKKVILTSAFAFLIAASRFAQKGGLVYQKEAQEPQQIFKKSTGPNFQHPDQEMILLLMENRMFGVLANYMRYFNNEESSKVTNLNPTIRMRPQDIK